MVPPPCSSSTNWERREATRGHRLHGVGHHLRPRPRAARRRGMGWHLLLPGRAGCHAARRLADRSPDQGRSRPGPPGATWCSVRSEEHTSELQSPCNLVCRLLLEKKKKKLKM